MHFDNTYFITCFGRTSDHQQGVSKHTNIIYLYNTLLIGTGESTSCLTTYKPITHNKRGTYNINYSIKCSGSDVSDIPFSPWYNVR
jgi:hypothetical protein